MGKFNDRLVAAHGPPDARWTLTADGETHRLWLNDVLRQEGASVTLRAAYGATLPAGHWSAFLYRERVPMIVAETRDMITIETDGDGSFRLCVLGYAIMRGDRNSVVTAFNRFLPYECQPSSN